MNADTSDYDLQREVMAKFAQRYPDMKPADWRHIVENYTFMVRQASKSSPKIYTMDTSSFPKAAERDFDTDSSS